MIKNYDFRIIKILATVAVVFSSVTATAREITGQVTANYGVSLVGAQMHVMQNNWSDEIIRSAPLDDTGSFTIECEGSCWLKATQESPNKTRGLSNLFQVPGDKNVVRLRMSPERIITVKASVPEKGNFNIAYQNLDTLDEIAGGTPFQANLSHDFKQTVPAGRYRVILKATTYPDAPKNPTLHRLVLTFAIRQRQ